MISLSVTACNGFSDSDMDIYEKIHKKYNKMESYTADLDLTVFSNKTENRYFLSQKTKDPDKFYARVTDDKGTFSVTTVVNNGITKVSAEGSEYSMTVPCEDYLGLLFVNTFLRMYFSSEDTSLTVDKALSKDKTVMEVSVENPDLNLSRIVLTFDNKTLLPYAVTIYNREGKAVAKGKYENFILNDEINESVFSTD
jgi:outer membrane lipoprotein-sorting protein